MPSIVFILQLGDRNTDNGGYNFQNIEKKMRSVKFSLAWRHDANV